MLLSASQIKTADDCLRKWAFKYLSGAEDPGTVSTELGKDCHTGWEMWLRDGTPPQQSALEIADQRYMNGDAISTQLISRTVEEYADRIAAICTSAIPHLPVPQSPGLEVEGEFQFEDHGVQYRGYKDLTWWADDTRILHDHKTTSALKWAKTREQLREDVQLNLYAQSEFQRWPVNEIECHWHYTTTDKTPTTRPVHLTVYRDAVDEQAAQIADRGRRLLKLYEERPDPNDLPPPADLAICDAYRGCPYKNNQCKLSTVDRIRGAFRYQQERKVGMNFFDRLKQTQAPPQAVQEPPKSEPKPEATAPRATLREKLQAPPPSPGATGVIPDSTLSGVTRAEVDAEIQKAKPQSVGTSEQVPTIRDTPKAGPGRPRKVKPAESPVVTQIKAAAEPKPIVKEGLLPGDFETVAGFTLYINCLPENETVTTLSEILAPLADQVAAELGIPDYRLADYGRGKDALVYALKAKLEQEPLTGAVAVDLRTSEGAMCAVTLRQFASACIRGY